MRFVCCHTCTVVLEITHTCQILKKREWGREREGVKATYQCYLGGCVFGYMAQLFAIKFIVKKVPCDILKRPSLAILLVSHNFFYFS